ncbi:MAG: CerR family C-terminal domain-containing protein [Planctomycetaceae bacterium]|jgi:AcrR family transcriptional regulator|nr:CerR family C-terminal domain-containing protein [Planctomycetaceae bacterium]
MRSKKTQGARQIILDVACKLFSKLGYNNVTTRMIAEKANVNQGSIHYHFGSKENLYVEVYKLANGTDKALDIETLLNEEPTLLNTPEGKSYAIFRIVSDWFHRHFYDSEEWKPRLIFRELFEPSPVYDRLVEEVFKPETKSRLRLYSLLAPDAPYAEAYVWVHYPDSQAVYYWLTKQNIIRYHGNRFFEENKYLLMKITIRNMLRALDLPLIEVLK